MGTRKVPSDEHARSIGKLTVVLVADMSCSRKFPVTGLRTDSSGEICFTEATEPVELVRTKRVSAVEIMKAPAVYFSYSQQALRQKAPCTIGAPRASGKCAAHL